MIDGCSPRAADPVPTGPGLERRLPPAALAAGLRAVIFDMDGLMLDTERWDRAAWRQVIAAHGHTLTDEFFATLVGRRETDTAQRMREQFGPDFPFDTARAQARAHFDHWMEHRPPPLKPGLLPLLDTLQSRGIALAVASSTARSRATLRLRDLAGHFDVSVFGDEVRQAKPHPEIYLKALALLGVSPARALALEDSPPGWAAAQAAGLTTVVIPDLLPPPPGAAYVCNSLTELEQWIQLARSDAGMRGLRPRAPGPRR